MDEFIEEAKESPNTKEEISKQLQKINPFGAASEADPIPLLMKNNVLLNEVKIIMGDWKMDLENHVGSKETEFTELHKATDPKLYKIVTQIKK